jgi:saccharopine dehydrogenase (NAD+, L-lysine-forming)
MDVMSQPHLWLRAEQRANETRVGLTPAGAADLLAVGFQVSVEDSADRVISTQDYADAGCAIVQAHSWPDAPAEAIIFGLKELPDDSTPLPHTHIMFGHAFKGQHSGARLLERFRAGGGTLLDLEYLTDAQNRRVAAFGYWGIGIGVGAWLAFGEGWRGAGLWTGLASGLAAVAVLMVIRWLMRERLGLVAPSN